MPNKLDLILNENNKFEENSIGTDGVTLKETLKKSQLEGVGD